MTIRSNLLIRGKDDQGAEVIRPYTPITLDSDVGFFELVVKVHPSETYHLRDFILLLGDVYI